MINAQADSFICPDISWSALHITGNDAESFLQGQMTNDINSADCVLTGICDLKGRLLATGYCLKISEQEFFFCVHNSLIDSIQQHWKLYAQFSKVNISVSNKIVCMQQHIAPTDITANRPDCSAQQIALYDKENLAKAVSENHLINENSWIANEIAKQRAHLSAATASKFLPQMLCLEKRGGVSFSKGCYLGQEIVARTQHLGKVKRVLQNIELYCTEQDLAGRELLSEAGNIAGTIVNSASTEKAIEVLAVIHEKYSKEPLTLQK
jgi:tRNA-modifying protein YgfZ